MINPGDELEIEVNIKGIGIIKQNVVVSFIEDNKIITCGHCLPLNSKISIGEILYSSGFDTIEEGKELGLIKIDSEQLHKFKNEIDGIKILKNRKQLSYNLVFNYFKRNYIYGSILIYVNQQLSFGLNKIGNWLIDNQITKLDIPFYLINGTDNGDTLKIYENAKTIFKNYIFEDYESMKYKIFKLTKSGYSGSPWLVDINEKIYHIGIHIGKSIGIRVFKNNVIEITEIAYVKPIF